LPRRQVPVEPGRFQLRKTLLNNNRNICRCKGYFTGRKAGSSHVLSWPCEQRGRVRSSSQGVGSGSPSRVLGSRAPSNGPGSGSPSRGTGEGGNSLVGGGGRNRRRLSGGQEREDQPGGMEGMPLPGGREKDVPALGGETGTSCHKVPSCANFYSHEGPPGSPSPHNARSRPPRGRLRPSLNPLSAASEPRVWLGGILNATRRCQP
jgi:hypothetical protein